MAPAGVDDVSCQLKGPQVRHTHGYTLAYLVLADCLDELLPSTSVLNKLSSSSSSCKGLECENRNEGNESETLPTSGRL